MDFFEKNGFPSPNSGIELERSQQIEGKFSLFIKDEEQRVIGCGIYEPLIDEEELSIGYWLRILPKINDAEGFNNYEKNNSFFFILADDHYYLIDSIRRNNPKFLKEKKLNSLIDTIKTKIKSNNENGLNQIKNQVAELSNKINEYETILRENESLIESLKENIRILEHYRQVSEDLTKEKNELERLLKCEYSRNVITVDELSKLYNNHQIERLLMKPFYFDETEILHHVRLGLKTATRTIIPNEITEMCWNQNYGGSTIKLRVKYEHKSWYEEANNYATISKTHCFLINEKGEIEHEEYSENEEDIYVFIK